MILVTGGNGLIGRALIGRLDAAGQACRSFDIASSAAQDTRDPAALAEAMAGVRGVVHLAAVSRVVWAERDPARTQQVNVDALRNLLTIAGQSPVRPWVIFASSREVYGEAESLPVPEDAQLRPMNTYARSKVAGERLAEAAREVGIRTSITRFSNVYGDVDDHADRVVPAFARAAATGGTMRLEGADNCFDFTQVSDVARGLHQFIAATDAGEDLPPVHFVTGRGTTLAELAGMAEACGGAPAEIALAAPRNFDVARFYGDPERARSLLGWQAEIGIEDGFSRLISDFAQRIGAGCETSGVLAPVAAE